MKPLRNLWIGFRNIPIAGSSRIKCWTQSVHETYNEVLFYMNTKEYWTSRSSIHVSYHTLFGSLKNNPTTVDINTYAISDFFLPPFEEFHFIVYFCLHCYNIWQKYWHVWQFLYCRILIDTYLPIWCIQKNLFGEVRFVYSNCH